MATDLHRFTKFASPRTPRSLRVSSTSQAATVDNAVWCKLRNVGHSVEESSAARLHVSRPKNVANFPRRLPQRTGSFG